MIQLASHFRSDDSRRHSEWLRQQQWFIKARHEQERREKIEEKLDDDFAAFASEVVMATEIQMREFETRLNTYDEATVAALMENQEALDAVRERLEGLLARAYVMEDGRRVFKTEDGAQVFDEFGEELSREEIDPDMIGSQYPTWEAFKVEKSLEGQLSQEQEALFEYQTKLDEARAEVSDGEVSEADLDELDAELEALMPASVREHAGVEQKVDATPARQAPRRDILAPNAESPGPSHVTAQSITFG